MDVVFCPRRSDHRAASRRGAGRGSAAGDPEQRESGRGLYGTPAARHDRQPALAARTSHTYYGDSHILHGVSLEVRPGEVVGLLGRNGVGKTTTLQTILGLPPPRRGEIRFRGEVDFRPADLCDRASTASAGCRKAIASSRR